MLQAVNVSSQKIAILTLPEWLRCEEPEDTPWKMGATRQNVTLTQRPCDELSPMLRLVVEFPIVLFLEELEEHLRKLYQVLWNFVDFLDFRLFFTELWSPLLFGSSHERQLSGIVKIPDNCRSWEFPNSSGLLRRFEFSGGGFTGDDQTNITFVLPNFDWPSAAWDEALGHVSPTNKSESVCRPLFAT